MFRGSSGGSGVSSGLVMLVVMVGPWVGHRSIYGGICQIDVNVWVYVG